MKRLDLVIRNPTGLHARPATEFVTLAKQYQSTITVYHGEKKGNAKSLLSVLALGVNAGHSIQIEISGADEESAAETLAAAVQSGLGEGERLIPVPETRPVVSPPAPIQAVVDKEPDFKGIPAAPGIAIGPIFRLARPELVVDESFTDVSTEQAKLENAFHQAREQLIRLRNTMQSRTKEEAAIFEVHLELLEDPELSQSVERKIKQGKSAGFAWQTTVAERAAVVAALDDPLLAARAADVRDVGDRVLWSLAGVDPDAHVKWPDHPVIVIANDLTPSDTATLDKDKTLGFCTAAGGPTSHSAIIARALGLPAVVSTGPGVLDLVEGTTVILDGHAGTLIIAPDETALAQAREKQKRDQERRKVAAMAAANPAITRDGHRVEVVANIGGVADAHKAYAASAEGIGLLRTEFLFLDRTTAPTEEEQFCAYRDIAQAMQGQPVIIRTLDIGGDKPLPYINVPREDNPFLGERGIRLCLARPDLLRQQVRSILRAAPFGHIRIMFPMVADLSEFRAARAVVEQVRAELSAPAVELGIMVEIPSAALAADAFAKEVDFFSIGTNDLTQYTLAVDRGHPKLASLSDGLHPAVLKLIDLTVQAAHKAGKWVGVCGELGADPQAVPILVGLGVDELSVGVPSLAMVKEQIRSLALSEVQAIALGALGCATASEVRAAVPRSS